MASNATQKVLHVGVKKQPGTLVYVRRVSGDLNEVCSFTKGRPGAVGKIITQVTFRREPGYFYYVDAAGDISRAKRVARGGGRKRAPAKPVTSTKRAVSAQGGTDYIALVLDKSASMRGITAAALKAFNDLIDSIVANAGDRNVLVSIYEFGTSLDVVRSWSPASQLRRLTHYAPNEDGTRLFDAVGAAISDMQRYEPTDPDADVSFLLHVVTDGAENRSRTFNASTVRSLMDKVQNTDRYTLTFMLPPDAKTSFCATFNIPEGNVEEWERTTAGVARSSTATQRGMTQYMNKRARGVRSVKTFYQTNASAITEHQLRSKLRNVEPEVRVWHVKAESDLRPFCEQNSGAPLLKGACFYQLTKPEKNVQAWKKLLIRRRGTSEIYAGDDARTMLGLPIGVDVGVNPGNHGDYDVFVQSASVNRKLVRGTDVIYWPAIGVPFTEGASAPVSRARR